MKKKSLWVLILKWIKKGNTTSYVGMVTIFILKSNGVLNFKMCIKNLEWRAQYIALQK